MIRQSRKITRDDLTELKERLKEKEFEPGLVLPYFEQIENKIRQMDEIWGYRAEGLIQTQEEADAYNAEYDLSYIIFEASRRTGIRHSYRKIAQKTINNFLSNSKI